MYKYGAKLLRVVDGDTADVMIDLGFDTWVKARLRFKGVDTWEKRTRDKEEKIRGLAAKERLDELINNTEGNIVIKTELDKKGKFGRILGVIWDKSKKKNFKYVTGHVKQGLAKKFSNKTEIVKIFKNWYHSNSVFEYYRREL